MSRAEHIVARQRSRHLKNESAAGGQLAVGNGQLAWGMGQLAVGIDTLPSNG